MKIRTYKMGRATMLHDATDPNGALIEIEASDGRTVQLYLNEEGDIHLRGWGNIPASIGNGDSVVFRCNLRSEEPTTCGICYSWLGKCDCDIQTSGDMKQ